MCHGLLALLLLLTATSLCSSGRGQCPGYSSFRRRCQPPGSPTPTTASPTRRRSSRPGRTTRGGDRPWVQGLGSGFGIRVVAPSSASRECVESGCPVFWSGESGREWSPSVAGDSCGWSLRASGTLVFVSRGLVSWPPSGRTGTLAVTRYPESACIVEDSTLCLFVIASDLNWKPEQRGGACYRGIFVDGS